MELHIRAIAELAELLDAANREAARLKAENEKLRAQVNEVREQYIRDWFAEGESFGHDSREESYG